MVAGWSIGTKLVLMEPWLHPQSEWRRVDEPPRRQRSCYENHNWRICKYCHIITFSNLTSVSELPASIFCAEVCTISAQNPQCLHKSLHQNQTKKALKCDKAHVATKARKSAQYLHKILNVCIKVCIKIRPKKRVNATKLMSRQKHGTTT